MQADSRHHRTRARRGRAGRHHAAGAVSRSDAHRVRARCHDRRPLPADFTIVIPTYNERDRIGVLLERVFDACDRDGLAVEVVIVDDNSADGTGAVADEWARHRRVRVIHRAGKLGLGTAVLEGFAVAQSRDRRRDGRRSQPSARAAAEALSNDRRRQLRSGGREPLRARRRHLELSDRPLAALARRVLARAAADAGARRDVGLLPDPTLSPGSTSGRR